MMIIKVTKSMFRDTFQKERLDNFSPEGLSALYDYLDERYPDFELDIIAICSEFTEYADIQEFWGGYNKDDYPDIETIERATIIVRIDDDSFIIQDF